MILVPRRSFWAPGLEDLLLRLHRIYHALSGQALSPFQQPLLRIHIKNKGIGVSEHSVLLYFSLLVLHIEQSGWPRPRHGPSQLDLSS